MRMRSKLYTTLLFKFQISYLTPIRFLVLFNRISLKINDLGNYRK